MTLMYRQNRGQQTLLANNSNAPSDGIVGQMSPNARPANHLGITFLRTIPQHCPDLPSLVQFPIYYSA